MSDQAAPQTGLGDDERAAVETPLDSEWHIGREWVGHRVEDACPCPQAPCGLVDSRHVAGCSEHDFTAGRTLRQGHPVSTCPIALTTDPEDRR